MQSRDVINTIKDKKKFSFYAIDKNLQHGDGWTQSASRRKLVALDTVVNILKALNCSLIVKDNDTGELYTIEPNKADD